MSRVVSELCCFSGRKLWVSPSFANFEDIMAVVDGREELAEELAAIDSAMADYIRNAFTEFLADQNFLDALPGCLSADVASQQRVSVLEKRVRAIAGH